MVKSKWRWVEMKDLIEYIAKLLVDSPEEVSVTELEGEQTSVIELTVAKEDLGKIKCQSFITLRDREK